MAKNLPPQMLLSGLTLGVRSEDLLRSVTKNPKKSNNIQLNTFQNNRDLRTYIAKFIKNIKTFSFKTHLESERDSLVPLTSATVLFSLF